VIILS